VPGALPNDNDHADLTLQGSPSNIANHASIGLLLSKNLTNKNSVIHRNELTYGGPMQLNNRTAFGIQGFFSDIPDQRQVMHKQQIIIMNQILYDIELSFHKLRFYIVVKRKIHRYPYRQYEARSSVDFM